MKHVSQEELLAFRDGEADDPRVREHLASCEKCQQAFDESRWSLAQRRIRAADEGEHPSSEDLTAFWDNALTSGPAQQIQRHLRSCDRCLAVYRRMRGVGSRRAYASPAPHLVREVQRRFTSRRSPIDLGLLWVRRIGEALELIREPAGEAQRLTECASSLDLREALDEMPAVLGMPASRHPASARARRWRLGGQGKPKAKPKPSKPVRLEAGNVGLELRVFEEGDERTMIVRLSWVDTNAPAADVRIRIEDDEGAEQEARTDEQGRARLRLPWGASKLSILTRTPFVLQLRAAVS